MFSFDDPADAVYVEMSTSFGRLTHPPRHHGAARMGNLGHYWPVCGNFGTLGASREWAANSGTDRHAIRPIAASRPGGRDVSSGTTRPIGKSAIAAR